MIERAFINAFERAREKHWDRLYVLVDVHGVVMEPDYTKPSTKIYGECVAPLRIMSQSDHFKLILWTCSREKDIEKYRDQFAGLGIYFDWVNENPEVQNDDALGDYTAKLYANLILDDKAGFCPFQDWPQILKILLQNKVFLDVQSKESVVE